MTHHPLGQGGPLLEAVFVHRPNQFTLELDLAGRPIRAAMADRGRLKSLLLPGRTILVEHRPQPHRKTPYQALAAQTPEGTLVSLDTHLPNRLVARALDARLIPGLPPYASWRAEQKVGHSRFDFLLELDAGSRLILEVKSVGRLDPDQVARFPDAPTTPRRQASAPPRQPAPPPRPPPPPCSSSSRARAPATWKWTTTSTPISCSPSPRPTPPASSSSPTPARLSAPASLGAHPSRCACRPSPKSHRVPKRPAAPRA